MFSEISLTMTDMAITETLLYDFSADKVMGKYNLIADCVLPEWINFRKAGRIDGKTVL